MGRGKVVCELTEFIHHQARDGISQNLKTHAGVYTGTHGHTKRKLLSDLSASSSVSLPRNTAYLAKSLFNKGN